MKYKPQGLYFFTKNKMLGLSLEGGGARGSYQAGAARAFMEKGIDFKGVSGTSIGSINGAMIAQGDTEQLHSIWENISEEKVLGIKMEDFKEFRKIADIIKEGGIDISMAQQILDQYIHEEKIRERKIDFGIVTFSLTEMKPVEIFIDEIPKGELKNYLLASSALPHFKMDKFHGIKYLDGGVYNALPTDLLVNKGYKEIWEIRLNSFGRRKNIDFSDQDVQIKIIEPKHNLSGILDFDNVRAREQLKLGYYDALAKLDNLNGNFFYLERLDDEDYFFSFLRDLPERFILEFIKALNIEAPPSKRTLFEEIIPRVAELLDLGPQASYEEIIVNFLEVQAMDLDMERFKIYKCKDFIREVIEKGRNYQAQEERGDRVIEFFLKNELLAKVAKGKSIRLLARTALREMGERDE